MPAKTPSERDEILGKLAAKLDRSPMTLQQAYDLFKEIESEVREAEEDPMLYNALMVVRSRLKESMERRAEEAGQADHWARAMKAHDARLILNPLFRTQDNDQDYIKVYRSLSPEQRTALQYLEGIGGIKLPRPEELQMNMKRNRLKSLFKTLFTRAE